MSKKSFIDSVEVMNPCTEDWETMHGNDRVRFCDHCAKDVKNISAVTRKEAMRIVRASAGGLCIRYRPDPVTKRPVFADQMVHITRRVPGIAAGVMTASLSLATIVNAQQAPSPSGSPSAMVSTLDKYKADVSVASADEKAKPAHTGESSLSGTISDQLGAVITNAVVTISSVAAGKTLTVNTNGEGVYKFESLEPGNYQFETAAPGFRAATNQITISEKTESVNDVSMGIEINATVDVIPDQLPGSSPDIGGVMVSVRYASPLARAVSNEDIDETRNLIVNGADVNGKDKNYGKITPLFIAVETGNVEITRMLLDFGAKVNARDEQKQTPLMRLDDDASSELADLLINNGAKISLTDNEGDTALILVAQYVKPEVLQKLVDAGADVNLGNKQGQTALMNAAENDMLENVRVLLQASAAVNLKNKDGNTALDLASNEEVKELLISFGAEDKAEPAKQQSDDPIIN